MRMDEYILCAAIHWDDGKPYPHQPTETGIVYCGYRHCDIFQQRERGSFRGMEQGFLTSRKRFVGRKEAAFIAVTAGQTDIGEIRGRELFSEELYRQAP